jgi:hypothetical protein
MGAFDDLIPSNAAPANAPRPGLFGDLIPQQRQASGILESLQAGYQGSATGLIARAALPDVVLDPSHAKWYERALSAGAGMLADLPEMIAGAVAGGAGGGALGGAVASVPGAAVGSVLGAGAGSFALPAAIRESYTQALTRGDITSASDFLDRARIVLQSAGKEGLVGALTFGAGGAAARTVGKVVAPAIGETLSVPAARSIIGTASSAAELGTMVVAPAALEGKLPEPEDFLNAAIVLGGMKGAGHVAGKLREVYAKAGVPPEKVVADAQRDPSIRDDLLDRTPNSGLERAAANNTFVYETLYPSYGNRMGFPQREGTPVEKLFSNFANTPKPPGMTDEAWAGKQADFRQAMFERANQDPRAFTNDDVATSTVPMGDDLTVRVDAAASGNTRVQVLDGETVVGAAHIQRGMMDSIAVVEGAKGRGIGEDMVRFMRDQKIANVAEVPDRSPGFVKIQKKVLSEPPKESEPAAPSTGEGEPPPGTSRAYHGTTTEFGDQYVGTGLGPHFGSTETANQFAVEGEGGHVRPVDLTFNNPLRLPDGSWEEPFGVMKKLQDAGIISEAEAAEFTNQFFKGRANTEAENKAAFDFLKAKIEEKGYDSIIYKNESEGGGDSYIALKPDEQVKSAFAAKADEIPRAYQPAAAEERGRQIVPGEKAYDVSTSPFAQEVPQLPGEPAQPTHVNYNYINSPEDTKLALVRISEVYEAEIQEQRRGTVDWAATSAEAARMVNDAIGGTDPQLLLPREPGTPAGAAEILARKQMVVGAAEAMMGARDELLAKGANASAEDHLAFLASIERLAMIQAEFLGARAEAGRALNILKNTAMDAERVRQIQDLIERFGKDPAKLAEMMKEIDTVEGAAKMAREIARATTWEKIVFAWKAGLVSGPITQIANIMGNTTFLAVRPIVDSVAAAFGVVRGAPADRVTAMEPAARIFGNLQGVMDAAKVAAAEFRMGEDTLGKSENYQAQPIGGAAGEVIGLPFRALSAADAFFRTMNERGEAYSLATRQATAEGFNPTSREFMERVARIVAEPTRQMQDQIDAAGLRFTFNTPLGDFGRSVQSAIRKGHLEWAIPFVRTPTNILKEMLRLTPAAPALGEWQAAFKEGGAARDQAFAEMAVGTSLMAATAALTFSGAITGAGSPDTGKRRVKQAAGWQPYSVKIGDKYYSYQRLQPIGTLVGLAADLAETWDHVTDGEADKAPKMLATAFANAVTNQTFLQGITTLVNAVSDPTRFGPRFLQSYAGSIVPGIVAQTAQMTDPVVRQVDSMLDAIKSRLPIERETLLPQRDVFGAPVETKERLGGLSPITESRESTDKVRSEAARLDVSAADAPKKTHVGRGSGRLGDVELTPEQRDTFQKVGGELAHDILAPVVNSPGWDDIPDLIQRRVYAKAFAMAHRHAAIVALPPEQRASAIEQITEKIRTELEPETE